MRVALPPDARLSHAQLAVLAMLGFVLDPKDREYTVFDPCERGTLAQRVAAGSEEDAAGADDGAQYKPLVDRAPSSSSAMAAAATRPSPAVVFARADGDRSVLVRVFQYLSAFEGCPVREVSPPVALCMRIAQRSGSSSWEPHSAEHVAPKGNAVLLWHSPDASSRDPFAAAMVLHLAGPLAGVPVPLRLDGVIDVPNELVLKFFTFSNDARRVAVVWGREESDHPGVRTSVGVGLYDTATGDAVRHISIRDLGAAASSLARVADEDLPDGTHVFVGFASTAAASDAQPHLAVCLSKAVLLFDAHRGGAEPRVAATLTGAAAWTIVSCCRVRPLALTAGDDGLRVFATDTVPWTPVFEAPRTALFAPLRRGLRWYGALIGAMHNGGKTSLWSFERDSPQAAFRLRSVPIDAAVDEGEGAAAAAAAAWTPAVEVDPNVELGGGDYDHDYDDDDENNNNAKFDTIWKPTRLCLTDGTVLAKRDWRDYRLIAVRWDARTGRAASSVVSDGEAFMSNGVLCVRDTWDVASGSRDGRGKALRVVSSHRLLIGPSRRQPSSVNYTDVLDKVLVWD